MSDWSPPNKEYPPPKTGEPPLHVAARMGDHAAIRKLCAQGADFNAVFDMQLDPGAYRAHMTPLMVAAGSGDGATAETLGLLMELGADPKLEIEGRSAASCACIGLGWNYRPGGDVARLQALLGAGAPIELRGRVGNRVFCRAAERGDPEIVRILLDHGADPCGFFDRDMALKECERFETPLSNPDEWPEGLPDGLRLPTVEEHASAPWSFEIPLACASKSGSVECVALLLARGADPSMRDNSGHTAMYGAGSEGVARLLMDHGVPIEDKDRLGWSPLVHAISDGADALPRIRGLIAAGANVNATHDRGFTVFMSAASTLLRDRRVIEALVEAGADPHAVTELGCNAFHAAVDASGEASWEPSVRSVLGYLHELGVDIELRNKVDITPLGGAVLEGNGIEVRVLVELGANPNADAARHECGESGCRLVRTPVIFAAIEAYQAGEKVEALVHGGARLDARNEHGQSPFDRARMALSEVQANKTLFRLADAERCVRILRGALAE